MKDEYVLKMYEWIWCKFCEKYPDKGERAFGLRFAGVLDNQTGNVRYRFFCDNKKGLEQLKNELSQHEKTGAGVRLFRLIDKLTTESHQGEESREVFKEISITLQDGAIVTITDGYCKFPNEQRRHNPNLIQCSVGTRLEVEFRTNFGTVLCITDARVKEILGNA